VAKLSIPFRLHSPKVMRLQRGWGGPGPAPPAPPPPGIWITPMGCLFMPLLWWLLLPLLLLLLLQLPLTFLPTDAILSLWATPALALDVLLPVATTDVAAVVGVVNMRSFPLKSS